MTIDSHHQILDAITRLLDKPENKKGLTIAQLADGTGFAKARIKTVLDASECCLKRRCHHPHLWWNDWKEIERTKYSPKRKGGRPRKVA